MMVNAPPPPPPPPGYNGGLTAAVQQQLIRLGYLHGVADGVSGPQTSAAISQFESVSGLPVGRRPLAAVAGQAAGDAVASAAPPLAIQAESAYLGAHDAVQRPATGRALPSH